MTFRLTPVTKAATLVVASAVYMQSPKECQVMGSHLVHRYTSICKSESNPTSKVRYTGIEYCLEDIL